MSEPNRDRKPRVVTQRDVARAAGVDRATVSRALDPKKRLLISTETLDRVLQAAEKLNYRTNVLARGLRTSKSGIIGLAVPSAKSGAGSSFDKWLGVFVASLEERLAQEGMTLLVTFEPDEGSLATGDKFTRSGMIDGLIRIRPGSGSSSLDESPIPLVTIGFEVNQSFDIVINEARGIAIGVEHLDRLGHRRIALITEPPSHPRGERHIRAFKETLLRLGLLAPDTQPLMAFYHARHPASAPEAVASILQRAPDLTAFLFTDDKAAMSGYGALRASRTKLPQDVSVLGWGDSDAGLFLLPPLSTLALPIRAAAFAAADLLNERINGREPEALPRVFSPYLIQRASTGPASRWER